MKDQLGSDHCPIVADIRAEDKPGEAPKRDPGLFCEMKAISARYFPHILQEKNGKKEEKEEEGRKRQKSIQAFVVRKKKGEKGSREEIREELKEEE